MYRWLIIAIAVALTVSSPARAQRLNELATFKGHAIQVASLAFSPDGKTLASGDEYGVVNLWNITTKKKLHAIRDTETYRWAPSLIFSTDGAALALKRYNRVTVIDVLTGRELARHERKVGAHGEVLEADTFLGADWRSRFPNTDVRSNGRYRLTGGQTVYVWDTVRDQSFSLTESAHDYYVAGFSPDGKMFALTCGNSVELWELSTRKMRSAAQVQGRSSLHDQDVLIVSPDLRLVVSGDKDGNLTLWDLWRSRKLVIIRCHTDRVTAVAFTRDGRIIATGSFDQTVKVWDISELRK